MMDWLTENPNGVFTVAKVPGLQVPSHWIKSKVSPAVGVQAPPLMSMMLTVPAGLPHMARSPQLMISIRS